MNTIEETVLHFIEEYKEKKGYPPTRRDIMAGCELSSPSVVQRIIDNMEDAGVIERDPGIPRGLRIPE